MKNKIIFSAVIALFFCALTVVQAADAGSPSLGNPIIAKGTGIEIKRGDLDDALAGYKAQLQKLAPDKVVQFQRQVLNSLINQKLLLMKATADDKAAGKKAADLQITAMIENVGSQEAFDQRLKTNGLTEADLRAKVTDEATAQSVLQHALKVTVTDDEVKNYYDTHTYEFEQPEMAHISHILIYTIDPVTREALSAAQLDVQRKLAENIVRAARNGVDFKKLAKQYSDDPGSKADGGELLPFPRGQMVHEIEDAAFSMTNNQISDVITTSTGYQIIKLLEKIPPKKTGYLTAIADIKQGLMRQKFAQLAPPYLDGLQKADAVEILDPDLKAAGVSSDL